MTFYALIAFFNMFFMQFLAVTPGFRAVAIIAQIAFWFYKASGFTGMTASTCQLNISAVTCRMLVVHRLPRHGFLFMTQGTVCDLGRPGLITQFAEGDHLGTVNSLTGAGMALGTGRSL